MFMVILAALLELYEFRIVRLNLLQFKAFIEAVVGRCSVKKVFLEISQNSQENTCARVSGLLLY